MKLTKSELKKIIKEEWNASEYDAAEQKAEKALEEYIKKIGLDDEGEELLKLIDELYYAKQISGEVYG